MKFSKKKKILYSVIAVVIIIVLAAIFFPKGKSSIKEITAKAERGEFIITVSTTGELEAKRAKDISGPQGLRDIHFYSDLVIERIIQEGTIVDSGMFVASIDKTSLINKIKEIENEIEKLETQLNQAKIDTALELRSARDQLINQKFELEQYEIEVEQSKYEAPAIQRQTQINLEKAERNYQQSLDNYSLRKNKSETQVAQVQFDLNQRLIRLQRHNEILNQFTIYAPQSGMVIYQKDWSGKKLESGSQFSVWDNIVAKLPDLSEMISRSYVNEVDISKVKVGQKVNIGIDALPGKVYLGEITSLANIGEQLRNSSAKVYETIIELKRVDSLLKPAMTTQCDIIIESIPDVLYIPLEALHGNDSIRFVYTGNVRQEVKIGKNNDNYVIIEEGLSEGQKVLLNIPEDSNSFKFVFLKKDE
ncbi:MAG: efflux RND transporter periplasmic adaptor subunit [Bacteroidales bacterium]|jgi:multidrug efflux pump subunit AcrA (membrane-fusion protein)|nr:efflux RND transporter periplasmic adaptor subunit [Bacteroidales bacterium]